MCICMCMTSQLGDSVSSMSPSFCSAALRQSANVSAKNATINQMTRQPLSVACGRDAGLCCSIVDADTAVSNILLLKL